MKHFLVMCALMCATSAAVAQEKVIGFFLANDAGLNKTKLSEWHDATSFSIEKKSKAISNLVFQTDRSVLTRALRYKSYNDVDACVRDENCVRKTLEKEMLDVLVIATLLQQGEKFEVELVVVHKDPNQKTIKTKTPYQLSNMMDEVASAVSALVVEQLQEQRGTIMVVVSPSDAQILCNGTPIKVGATQLKAGTYVIQISKNGFITHEEKVRVVSGDQTTISVTLQEKISAQHRVAEEGVSPSRRPKSLEVREVEIQSSAYDRKKAYLISASVTSSLSVAAFIVGGVYAAKVQESVEKAQRCSTTFCPDFIGSAYTDEKAKANDNQLLANMMWGIGGATTLASITLWVLYGLEEDTQHIPDISFVPVHDGGMVLITY